MSGSDNLGQQFPPQQDALFGSFSGTHTENNQKIMAAGRERKPPDLSNPQPGDAPRDHYRHTTGQMILPEPAHSDIWPEHYGYVHENAKKDYDGSGKPKADELDRHGNVFQWTRFRLMGDVASRRRGESREYRKYYKPDSFNDWGPQMSQENANLWNNPKYTVHKQISTSAVLHTGQQSLRDDGKHTHITGPMDPGSTVKILLHEGTPWIVDGHHRLQEARGRGLDLVHAHILDTSKLPEHERKIRGYE